MTTSPRVELLWWSGCPSHGTARAMLAEAMTGLGLDPAGIETVQVVTEADAARERFTGSPTIRVDGSDIDPLEQDAPPALTCRVYFRQDGRPSPLPDPARVRHALEQALDHA